MGLLGGRPTGRERSQERDNGLPAGRLEQLMTFVDLATVPTQSSAPKVDPTPPRVAVVDFPEPIMMAPRLPAGSHASPVHDGVGPRVAGGGKRRLEVAVSA